MVSTEKAVRGLVNYLNNEFLTNLSANGWQRPLAATVIGLSQKNVEKLINTYKTNPMLVAIGVFDECGSIDIDTVKDEFIKHLGSEGMRIDIALIGGVTFHKNDIEKLYTYIMNA